MRLTTAQALVRFLQVQYSERDGERRRAIPAMFGYNFLLGKVKQLSTEIENYASSLADRLELESKN